MYYNFQILVMTVYEASIINDCVIYMNVTQLIIRNGFVPF